MREFLIVTSVDNLVPSEDFGKFALMPHCEIYSKSSILDDLCDEEIKHLIGPFGYTVFLGEKNLLINRIKASELDNLPLKQALDVYLGWLRDLYTTAWILYDHAFNSEFAYIFELVKGRLSNIWFNGLHAIPRSASFSIEPLILGRNDLELVAANHHHVMTYFTSKKSSLHSISLDPSLNRIGRALKLVYEARIQDDIGLKVLFFSNSFECLFSTDSTELTYRLSERIAFFSEKYLYRNKRTTYGLIKSMYEVRSKLVHGGSIEQKRVEGLRELSTNLDRLLRDIFKQIFMKDDVRSIFELSNDKMNEIFLKTIIGE